MTPAAPSRPSSGQSPAALRCWVVSDGRRGMENQALGLAEALARRVDLDIAVKRLVLAAPYRWLPYALLGRMALDPARVARSDGPPFGPPWPDVLIGCGRHSVPVSLAVRHLSRGRTLTVQAQNPRVPPHQFDLVFPPRHDGLAGPNVVALTGAPHRVSTDQLAAARRTFADRFSALPHPRVAVLIGGDSKSHRLDDAHLARILDGLRRLQAHGAGLAVTTSRRTGADKAARIRDALEPGGAYVWNGTGENPYFGLLAHADHILVTADSTNMITEAAATGKPIHIVSLAGGSEKFDRFHADLAKRGIVRSFNGQLETWTYAPLRETERAADVIENALASRAARREGGHP